MSDLKLILHKAISENDFSNLIGLTLKKVTEGKSGNLYFEFENEYGVSADMNYFLNDGGIAVSECYSKSYLREIGVLHGINNEEE